MFFDLDHQCRIWVGGWVVVVREVGYGMVGKRKERRREK